MEAFITSILHSLLESVASASFKHPAFLLFIIHSLLEMMDYSHEQITSGKTGDMYPFYFRLTHNKTSAYLGSQIFHIIRTAELIVFHAFC